MNGRKKEIMDGIMKELTK